MRAILQLLVRQSPPGRAACLVAMGARRQQAEAGRCQGLILLVLGGPASLVLQSRLGGKGGFPTRGQLEAGPLTGASLGTGSWCHGGDGVESGSHLFLASSRYRVKPTSAVTAAPSATRSQKDATPSSTAFRWGKVAAVASLV